MPLLPRLGGADAKSFSEYRFFPLLQDAKEYNTFFVKQIALIKTKRGSGINIGIGFLVGVLMGGLTAKTMESAMTPDYQRRFFFANDPV